MPLSDEEITRLARVFQQAICRFSNLQRLSFQPHCPEGRLLEVILDEVPNFEAIKSLHIKCACLPPDSVNVLKRFKSLQSLTLLSPTAEVLHVLPDILQDLRCSLKNLAFKVRSFLFSLPGS